MSSIIVIMGAGQDPNGDCLGLRPYVEDLCDKTGSVSQFHAHDEPGLEDKFTSIDGSLVLIGHSFGGYEALRVAHALDLAGRSIDVLCLLDPKPKPFGDWINPAYEFPLPTNAKTMQCFWSGFGRPFKGHRFSLHLNINHEDFPGDPIAQDWITDAVKAINP